MRTILLLLATGFGGAMREKNNSTKVFFYDQNLY